MTREEKPHWIYKARLHSLLCQMLDEKQPLLHEVMRIECRAIKVTMIHSASGITMQSEYNEHDQKLLDQLNAMLLLINNKYTQLIDAMVRKYGPDD